MFPRRKSRMVQHAIWYEFHARWFGTLADNEMSVRLPPQIVSRPRIVRLAHILMFVGRKQAGFFLPLSGGIDSCATAVIGTWGRSLRFNLIISLIQLTTHCLLQLLPSHLVHQVSTDFYGAVHSMTRLVLQAIESGENPQVLTDLHRICGEEEGSTWVPKSPQEIANRIFYVRTPDLISSPS